MSLIEDELGIAFHDSVRRKSNNTRDLKSRAKKISGGAPEVMVKITSFGKGAKHAAAQLDYISRNGEVEIENDRGELLNGKDDVQSFFKEWETAITGERRHKNQRDTMHMIFSMPESVEPEEVQRAVREFTKKTFGKNHEYVFALHTDTLNPHCHVTVKLLGFDGKRLNPRKADLQAWREGFADAMQMQGVEANASPRQMRGVVKKAEKSVIRHIERGSETRPPRMPYVKAMRIKEVARELTQEHYGGPVLPDPWEERIVARQKAVRFAWLKTAESLKSSPSELTFTNIPQNVTPDYDKFTAADVRRILRLCSLCKFSHKDIGPRQAPIPIARIRNLSSIPLIQHQATHEMLPQVNARGDLGQSSGRAPGANNGLRRPATDVEQVGRIDGKSNGTVVRQAAKPISDAALAARIESFVNRMPPVETAKQTLKRELRARFARSETAVALPVEVKPKPAVSSSKPSRDIER